MVHKCPQCAKSYFSQKHLKAHVQQMHSDISFKCPKCNSTFNVKSNLTRHIKRHDVQEVFTCTICAKSFARKDNLKAHMRQHPQTQSDKCAHESALQGSVIRKTLKIGQSDHHDIISAIHSNTDEIIHHVTEALQSWRGVKWQIIIKVRFVRNNEEGQPEFTNAFFNGSCQLCLASDEIEPSIEKSVMKIMNSFSEFQRNGSSWVLDKAEEIHLKMVQYKPIGGSSYIATPKKLQYTRAIVNPRNSDNKCFMWAILAGLYPVKKNKERISNYSHRSQKLNFLNIHFPVKTSDISKFETQNQVSINVFGWENDEIFPARITKHRFKNHVNLLLLSRGRRQHYCLVTSLNRLLHHTKKHTGTTYFCQYCLQGFTSEKILTNHADICSVHAPLKIELPDGEDKWLAFKDWSKQLRVTYVVYADFESIIMDLPVDPSHTKQTQKARRHIASGFTYKIVSTVPGEFFPHTTYRGPNTAEVFVEHMLKVEEDLKKRLRVNIPMKMTAKDETNAKNATHCFICKKPLNGEKVRDHNHATGAFRGICHNSCNLNYKDDSWFPVYFHNLRG